MTFVILAQHITSGILAKNTGVSMENKVVQFRRDVLPANIFEMIQGYMHGDITALHIIATTADGKVISTSSGDIPVEISRHDVKTRAR